MIDIDKAVVFAEREGYRALELDIYRDADASGVLPVVAFIHGGGWRVGHRRPPAGDARVGTRVLRAHLRRRVRRRRARATASAGKPRSPPRSTMSSRGSGGSTRMPMSRRFASDRRLRLGRIGGWDIGGVGRTRTRRAAGGGCADLVRGERLHGVGPGSGRIRPRRTCSAVRSVSTSSGRVQASPVSHVRADAPPFFVQHGESRHLGAVRPRGAVGQGLGDVGAPAELDAIPGADHFFGGAPDVEAIFERGLAFLRRVDAGSGP